MTNVVINPENPSIGDQRTIGGTRQEWDGSKWKNVSFGNHEVRISNNFRATEALLKSLGLSGNFGFFNKGFTYTEVGDVGIDDNQQFWVYNGSLPFEVTKGTVPSEPDYSVFDHTTAVGAHDGIYARQYTDLKSIDLVELNKDGLFVELSGFVTGSSFDEPFRLIYDSSADKSTHNGVTVISPESISAWDGSGDLTALFNWAGTGLGCWVRNFTSKKFSATKLGLVEGADLSIIINRLVSIFTSKFNLDVDVKECNFNSALSKLDRVCIKGLGKDSTRITKTFNGDLCADFSDYSKFEDLYIFGNNTAGELLIMQENSQGQYINNIKAGSVPLKAIVFEYLGGLKCRISNSDIGSTSTTVAAISSRGGYLEDFAASRHFTNNETFGGILYDVSDMNDTYITGGYTQGFLFSDNTSKCFINNMRWGVPTAGPADYDIRGENLGITNVTCSVSVGTSVNLYCTGSEIDIVASRWDINDFGSGNSVGIKEREFTPTWEGSISNPSIGSGRLNGRWSREGNIVNIEIEMAASSSTTFGSGDWRFGLPDNVTPKDLVAPTSYSGSGLVIQGGGSQDYMVVADTRNEWDYCLLRSVNTAGNFITIGSGTEPWSSTTSLRVQFQVRVN